MKKKTLEQEIRQEIAEAMIGVGYPGIQISLEMPLIADAVLTGQPPDMQFLQDFIEHLPRILSVRSDIEEAMQQSARNTKN